MRQGVRNGIIAVGLVGYGLGGSVFHAPLIRACPRLELTAILTSREVPERVASLDELIKRCDLVVVASPNKSHFPIAKQALEAGRHLVIDKPFTVTIEQADELIRIAAERKLVLSAFHNRRWDGDFLTVRELLASLGELYLFETDWDRFRPVIRRGWREEAEPGAGAWNDLGPHMVDQALQLFGMPTAIDADIFAQRPDALVDDYFDVTLYYGALRACLRSSSLLASPRARFAVHGTGGSFVKFGLDPQEAQLKAGIRPGDPGYGMDVEHGTLVRTDGSRGPVATERGNYPAFYEQIAASILDGTLVPVSAQDARDGLLLIDLARRASAHGQRLSIPAASSLEG